MDQRRLNRLHDLGLAAWAPRATAQSARSSRAPESRQEPAAAIATLSPEASDERSRAIATLDWPGLKAAVQACTACGLRAGCNQTVFGVGDEHAKWLVIGEAPGAEEDRQGEPFVGRAGLLLNSMLLAIGLKREQVYIANILKCRPPNNRDPRPEEAGLCRPHLERQIALVKPQIILAVGRIAAQNLLHTDTPIGRLRGAVHTLGETPVVVTYHPAYLLRTPSEKRKSWDDLKLALRTAKAVLA